MDADESPQHGPLMNPTKEIRISGGREVNLRSLQPFGLFATNFILSAIISQLLDKTIQQLYKGHRI